MTSDLFHFECYVGHSFIKDGRDGDRSWRGGLTEVRAYCFFSLNESADLLSHPGGGSGGG